MKKIFLLLILLCSFQTLFSQNKTLTAVIGKSNSRLLYYEIQINDVHFQISEAGDYMGFYLENSEGNFTYYDDFNNDGTFGKLKTQGAKKIIYWDDYNFDGVKYGKPKSIADIDLDYWRDETFDRIKFKKLKNIGTIKIDYFDDEFSDKHNYGKIRKIGKIVVSYRDNFVFDANKYEQIKQIGNTTFEYWDDTFDKSTSGKLKSINGKNPNVKITLK
ncbi:hypothetical protein [Epilithonimonas sp. JDS]|uniref:hypothetical protein n=1 Tax=Epilithonimonas sp. JDS TaxID=2902797 RepID=UPI001E48D189|nr:hypothetical protein [Epilithonimonas sp. JDS]